MEEGKLAQGGEGESTVLETVIEKKHKPHMKTSKQKISNNKRVLEHLNTLKSDRQLYSIHQSLFSGVKQLKHPI